MTDMRPIVRRQIRTSGVPAEYPPAIDEIRRLRKQGWSYRALAKRYGIEEQRVRAILGETGHAF